MPAGIDKLKELQKQTKQIRNICILAHVDHGKTTLADSLIASNGIISQRLAGKMRYMDSREDEQLRQITMKSSSISLYFQPKLGTEEFLINLIDSPGHVDFSSEVAAAIRLCDGAIIVVDSVEGVCAQTRICIKQAYEQRLKTILFLNKVDRLILEKRMSVEEAYLHLQRVLENVNSVMGNLFASDVLAKEEISLNANQQSALQDSDDSNLYFDPRLGNVVFGSAIDGWGFTLMDFARQYESKCGLSAEKLKDQLWGDQYFDAKHKKFNQGAADKGKEPAFVQLVLRSIWKIYETVEKKDLDSLLKICEQLKVTYKKQAYTDCHIPLKNIFNQWLPLEESILAMATHHIPNPSQVGAAKIHGLISAFHPSSVESYPKPTQILFNDLVTCDAHSDNKIAFISKMFPVPFKVLAASDRSLLVTDFETDETVVDGENFEVLIGFARIFSGTLKCGEEIYLVDQTHDPRLGGIPTKVQIKHLYLMMGKHLERVEEAPAGNVIGIGGLQSCLTKTATIANTASCPPFNELPILAQPILRVAIEPEEASDLPKLRRGLRILNQVDSSVQVLVQSTGEFVLLTLGGVHLEKCIKDLEECFARIKLRVSSPIVPFMETIVAAVEGEKAGDTIIQTSNNNCTIKILAQPLSASTVQLLDKNKEILKIFTESSDRSNLPNNVLETFNDIRSELQDCIQKDFAKLYSVDQIWAMGSKKTCTNFLLNASDYQHSSFWNSESSEESSSDVRTNYDHAFVNGFQAFVEAGPLCHEPVHGVCFIIQEWNIESSIQLDGQLSGQLITAVKEGCKRAFQMQPQRLVAPIYSCFIVANQEVIGKLESVLGKRGGKTLSCEMIEGSSDMHVVAELPVIESMDLASEIRVKTSGLAMPQLSFSHWAIVDIDPFWTPRTEDELEQFGNKADFVNKAKVYMDAIRERKGLHVDKKLVEFAEKQRTLSKNK